MTMYETKMPDLNAAPRSPRATGVSACSVMQYHRGIGMWVTEIRDWSLLDAWTYGRISAKHDQKLWEKWGV
jgi:hypothetical protein